MGVYEILLGKGSTSLKNEINDLKKAVEDLQKANKDLLNDFNVAKMKYTAIIEELTTQNRLLNDKILKKAQYLEQKENKINQVDIKQAFRNKMMQRMGIIPKNLNTTDTFIPQNETKA